MDPTKTPCPTCAAELHQLLADHTRFDAILSDVEFLGERRSFMEASKRLGELRRALEAHLQAEQALLVPLCASCRGTSESYAAVLRQEGTHLKDLCGALATALSRWDYPGFVSAIEALDSRLRAHAAVDHRAVPATLGEGSFHPNRLHPC